MGDENDGWHGNRKEWMTKRDSMEEGLDCLICGGVLDYLPETSIYHCFYCGSEHQASIHCPKGHYVCDRCHSLKANDVIQECCLHSKSTDPCELATALMRHLNVTMHGPEHHFLVPAVLLVAYNNVLGEGTGPSNETDTLRENLSEARKRASRVPGGFCGTHGNCGAGVGTGIFMSIALGSTSLAREEWGLSNRITAQSLENLARYGGPRCCKRTTYLALLSAVRFTKEHRGVIMDVPKKIVCQFSERNRECLEERCPFFPR